VKIRQQLALKFTIVSALITGAILFFIYMLMRGFVHDDFVERLTQQSRLEVLHYATPHVRDVMPSVSFLLVNPVTTIYDETGKQLYEQGGYKIPQQWFYALKNETTFHAERDAYTTIGRKYDINSQSYFVFVSDKDLPGQHELDMLVKAIVVGWILSLIFAYLAGSYYSSNALNPMNRVVKEVNQITKDNLGHRLKLGHSINSADEIDELILTFNALLTRIESAFIAQKRFVQNASHELKTPLTAIMAEAELALARDRTREEYKRTMEVITHETERLVTITHGLLSLARMEEGDQQTEMSNVNVQDLLNDTLVAFKLHHPNRDLVYESEKSTVYVRGNVQLLQLALLNILDNAAKYSKDRIVIDWKSRGNEVKIGVRDFGIGIPANEINRLFSPLFRGSNARNIPGAGLGLPLVKRIIHVHAGQLNINSEEGKGTHCEIVLPITT
jgi:signal transduction histidine kinase